MPSPFPGMDPFLENRAYWSMVHTILISELFRSLNRQLPPSFGAVVEQRVYVTGTEIQFQPDTFVVQTVRNASVATPPHGSGSVNSGTALLTRSPSATSLLPTPRRIYVETLTVRERFLEVRTLKEKRVVALIELLSPANKSNGRGREEYQNKQQRLLESDVHFLEIDLLRAGLPTLSPPKRDIEREFGAYQYAASLHRAGGDNGFDVWAWNLEQPLPSLLVPLTEDFADCELNLQEVFTRAYDDGLGRGIDYEADPEPPLTDTQKAWAQELLQEAGLRPSVSFGGG